MSVIIPKIFLVTLVGLTETEAQTRCGKAGLKCRRRGGIVTYDYNPHRVNIRVSKDGLVTEATVG